MNLKRTAVVLASALVITAGITYASNTLSSKPECVTVYVDYGVLDSGTKETKCVNALRDTNAIDVLSSAGIEIEGTGKYGLAVACRVNGLPNAVKPVGVEGHEDYIETCAEMPAAFAYWAVLIKRLPNTANPVDQSTKWGWAQTGINEITLSPGDSIGLVFAENEKVEFPK